MIASFSRFFVLVSLVLGVAVLFRPAASRVRSATFGVIRLSGDAPGASRTTETISMPEDPSGIELHVSRSDFRTLWLRLRAFVASGFSRKANSRLTTIGA